MDFMKDGNQTAVAEFILLVLSDNPLLRIVLFTIILCIFLVTVSGNLSTILLIRVSSQLHHPMYFFLSHLASVDIGISPSVTPNMLVTFLIKQNTISYFGCCIQFSSAAFFGTVECFLLASMAYDRFLAICNPLLYSTKMSTQVCIQVVLGSYIKGFLNASFFNLFFFFLIFCGPNNINHFFGDFAPLLELSYSDVTFSVAVISFSAGFIAMVTAFVIAISYSYIFITILKMHSTEGRQRAFFTFTSHLIAVTLLYGTVIFIYVMPKFSYSTDQNKVMSMFYMVVVPMLNPLIYSLRNNEINGALTKHLSKITLS